MTVQRSDPSAEPFGVPARDVPCFALESEPGDVVFFDQCTWHAAFGGRAGRRMFTLNFGAKPTSAAHTENLIKTYQANLGFVRTMGYTNSGRVYEDAFLASDRPRIRSMVGPLVELGFK
jgi:hypothetical protein